MMSNPFDMSMAIASSLYLGGPCFLRGAGGELPGLREFDVTVRPIFDREHVHQSHCGESDIESATIMT